MFDDDDDDLEPFRLACLRASARLDQLGAKLADLRALAEGGASVLADALAGVAVELADIRLSQAAIAHALGVDIIEDEE